MRREEKKFNILITSSGTVTAQCAIKGFREQDEFDCKLITADMNPHNAGRYFGNVFYQIPAAKDKNYIASLLDICKKEGINVLIPILDVELPRIAENRKKFMETGCYPIVSSLETIRLCEDKYRTYQFFKRININTPETYKASDILNKNINMEYPIFGKPACGIAGIGNEIIKNEDHLIKWADKISDPLIQKVLKGQEFSIDLLTDLEGRVIEIVPRTREETRHGASTKGVTIKDYEIMKKAKYIAENLELIGPCNIQCFREENGIYFVEINPRFSGAHSHSIASGMNSSHLLLKMLNGERVEPRIGQFTEGLRMLRYWAEVFIDAKGKVIRGVE